MIKVSVVIPVYNVELFLPECMDSVINQTLKELEVICIDDVSPDRCGEILDEYAARDDRVKVFHLEKNGRQGHGRNLGLKNAKGKYVYFLDSDDKIRLDALERLYSLAEEESLDCINFGCLPIYDSKELEEKFSEVKINKTGSYPNESSTGQQLFDLMEKQYDWSCLPQTFFWKTDMLLDNDIYYPELSEHEDEVFAFKAILTAQRAKYIQARLVFRRYRDDSVVTRKVQPRNFHGYMTNFWLMNQFVAEKNIHTYGTRFAIAIMYGMCRSIYKELDFNELRDYCSRTPEDLVLFEAISSMIQTQEYWYTLGIGTLGEMDDRNRIWIYGTGSIARKVADSLKVFHVKLEGFIAEGTEAALNDIDGKPVITLKDLHPSQDTLVIIALPWRLLKRAKKALKPKNVRYKYYQDEDAVVSQKIINKLRKMFARFLK